MTSVGLVANNYSIVDPIVLDQANINYTNNFIQCDKDVKILTSYTSLNETPNDSVAISGLIKTSISNLQNQIDNINIPTNSVSINSLGSNLFSLNGIVSSVNYQMLKVELY